MPTLRTKPGPALPHRHSAPAVYARWVFVTLEGPEGSGKSTVCRLLVQELEAEGRAALLTREPGDGEFGSAVRSLLLEGGGLDPKAELFLFLADRAQHVSQTVHPALAEGRVVVCDRYADSTLVYQGYGRGLPLDTLRAMNRFCTGGLEPGLTLLLDVPPEVGLGRLATKDRLDHEPMEFHHKVRDGFLAEAAADPRRWRVLDASRALDAVFHDAWAALQERLVGAPCR
jgi:dTMP kinase